MVNSFGLSCICFVVAGDISLAKMIDLGSYQFWMSAIALISGLVFVGTMFIDHCERKLENVLFIGLGIMLCLGVLLFMGAMRSIYYAGVAIAIGVMFVAIKLILARGSKEPDYD